MVGAPPRYRDGQAIGARPQPRTLGCAARQPPKNRQTRREAGTQSHGSPGDSRAAEWLTGRGSLRASARGARGPGILGCTGGCHMRRRGRLLTLAGVRPEAVPASAGAAEPRRLAGAP
ncbi:MAG: hypothetical protein JWM18_5149 [Chloroflexi bacterium]|nr:hypothetical protein [Chloroflexota bacterium]